MPKPVYSSPGAAREAHDGLADALRPSLPALLYGSGDVTPPETDAATVGLLSHLTASYVAALVDAAVEAHDILTDGAGGILPRRTTRTGGWGRVGGGEEAEAGGSEAGRAKAKTKTEGQRRQIGPEGGRSSRDPSRTPGTPSKFPSPRQRGRAAGNAPRRRSRSLAPLPTPAPPEIPDPSQVRSRPAASGWAWRGWTCSSRGAASPSPRPPTP